MNVDAVLANREALKLLNEKAPEQLSVRAYWSDVLTRLLIRMEPGSCVSSARSTFFLREQIFDLVRAQAPEQIDSAITQMAIAANQLGFCYISSMKWKEAVDPLELSLRLLLSRSQQNEVEIATVRHNLASAYIALGDRRALEFAEQALSDRQRLNVQPLLVENSRSVMAAALYLNGQKEESTAVLRTWQERMTVIDDFRSPTDDMMMFIDGQLVGLGEILGESNVVSNRVAIGGATSFGYSVPLLQSW